MQWKNDGDLGAKRCDFGTPKHLLSRMAEIQACAKRVQVVDCTSHNNYQDYLRKDIKRDSTSLTSQNSELKFRLQAMEQQAQLRDAGGLLRYRDVEGGSDATEFILLGANTIQKKRVGSRLKTRPASGPLPSNDPGFFHRRVRPPHLYPFVDAEVEGYVTEYVDTTKRLQAIAIYIPLSGWVIVTSSWSI
ncbi:hypothetical protein Tco_1263323 [Tanacetum coccineum]